MLTFAICILWIIFELPCEFSQSGISVPLLFSNCVGSIGLLVTFFLDYLGIWPVGVWLLGSISRLTICGLLSRVIRLSRWIRFLLNFDFLIFILFLGWIDLCSLSLYNERLILVLLGQSQLLIGFSLVWNCFLLLSCIIWSVFVLILFLIIVLPLTCICCEVFLSFLRLGVLGLYHSTLTLFPVVLAAWKVWLRFTRISLYQELLQFNRGLLLLVWARILILGVALPITIT